MNMVKSDRAFIVLLLVFGLLAAGCSSDSIDDAAPQVDVESESTEGSSFGLPHGVVFFPTYRAKDAETVALIGTTSVVDGCVVVDGFTLVWPEGSSVEEVDGRLVLFIADLFDSSSVRVVIVGETLSTGGNSGEAGDLVDEWGNSIPDGCPTEIWWVSG